MAFVFRTSRDDTISKSNPILGPGTYIGQAEYAVNQGYAPFLSKGSRKEIETVSTVPGPGSYNVNPNFSIVKSELNPTVDASKLKTKSSDLFDYNKSAFYSSPNNCFVSKVKRFDLKKNENPGPGSYDIEIKPDTRQIARMKSESSIALLKMQSPPSIPSHDNIFGYEEANNGMLIKQSNPDSIYKGEKGDTIGPGQYELPVTFGKTKTKGLNWQRSKSKRDIGFASKQSIGPGQYNIDKINIFPIYKFQNSSVFSSKVERMYNGPPKMKVKYKRRPSNSAPRDTGILQQLDNSDEDEGIPGPGYYYNPSNLSEFSKEPYTGKMQYFGSTVERFPRQKAESIGPGKYSVTNNFNVSKERMAKMK